MENDVAQPTAQKQEHESVVNARQRLALQRETVGPRHPDYATGLNQLALLLIMHGDPDSAEPLLREALDIRKETLGEYHPDYATSLSSLAGLLWARGDLDGAEPLLRQALDIRWVVLGANHPKSIVSLNSLEQLLQAKRDWPGAEKTLAGQDAAEPDSVAESVDPRVSAHDQALGEVDVRGTSGYEPPVETAPEPEARPAEEARPAPEPEAFAPTPEPPAPAPAPEPVAQGAPEVWEQPAAPAAPPVPEPQADEPAPWQAPPEAPQPTGWTNPPEAAPQASGPAQSGEAPVRLPEIFEGEIAAPLAERLMTLSDGYARLAERLTASAETLKSARSLPDGSFYDQVPELRQHLEELRDEVRHAGHALSVPSPEDRRLESLEEIGAFLAEIAEAEQEHGKAAEIRNQALGLLDRVDVLTHKGQADFAPLHELQARARELRQSIADAPRREHPPQVAELITGEHPFTQLLALVDTSVQLSDEAWAHARDVVEREFGKPLAVAAARERIVFRQ